MNASLLFHRNAFIMCTVAGNIVAKCTWLKVTYTYSSTIHITHYCCAWQQWICQSASNVTLHCIAYLNGLLTGSKEIRLWSFEVSCDYVNEHDVFRKLAVNSQKTSLYTFTNISLCNAQNSEAVSHISVLLSQHMNPQYKTALF